MSEEILTFGNIEIEKNYYYKIPIVLKDADMEKVLVFKTIYFAEKSYKEAIT